MSLLGDAGTGAVAGATIGGVPGAVVGGVIGAGASLVGDAVNYFTNKSNNNQQIKLWNMNNAYNTPAAQMQRLRAAGLNPNLVYGSGSVVGNSSSGAPTVQRPDVGSGIGQAGNIVSQMYQLIQAQMNIIKTQADTKNVEANTDNTVANTQGQVYSNQFAANSFDDRLMQVRNDAQGSFYNSLLKGQQYDFNTLNNPQLLKEQVFKTISAGYAPGYTQQQMKLMASQYDFNSMQNKLMSLGISPGSDDWLKILGGIVHKLVPGFNLLSH